MEDVRARRLRLCGHLARAKPSTDYAHALHSLTMQCIRGFGGDALCKLTFCVTLRYSHICHWRTGSIHLAVKDNMAADSRIRFPACKYWYVHCLAMCSRWLYVEAICEDSHAPDWGEHVTVDNNKHSLLIFGCSVNFNWIFSVCCTFDSTVSVVCYSRQGQTFLTLNVWGVASMISSLDLFTLMPACYSHLPRCAVSSLLPVVTSDKMVMRLS